MIALPAISLPQKGHAFSVVALEEVPKIASEKAPSYLSFKLETAGPDAVGKQ